MDSLDLLRMAIRLIVLTMLLLGIWWVVGYLVIPALMSLVGVAAVL